MSKRHLMPLVLFAVMLAAASASAQETLNTFEFSFSNPGARSLGLGGAFAALADDATAAFANPAGLVQLIRPEVSAEGRYWSRSTPYITGGRYEGKPTGLGLDTIDGLRFATTDETASGLSFLSFVYPKGKWSLAVYRHQLAKFRARAETQGLFHLDETGQYDARQIDRRWATDLDIVSYGLAGGYRVSDRFSLGLGIVYFDGRLEAPFEWNVVSGESLETIFGPNPYLPERRLATGALSFDGTDWKLSVGVLWRPSERWSFGGFFRQGPDFQVSYEIVAGPLVAIIDPSISDGAVVTRIAGQMPFPDVYGLGVAFQSVDGRLALSFEWDRVEYSSIFGDFTPSEAENLGREVDLRDVQVEFAADDGDEFHFGAEYAFLDLEPVLAVRAGVWLDPDHRFRSVSDDVEHRLLFQAGQDEVHVAVGCGLAFKSFQIDLAADFSDRVDTVSLSAIYSF
jgi:long-subunit fatty acid transport protein